MDIATLSLTSATLQDAVDGVDLTQARHSYEYSVAFHKAQESLPLLVDPLKFLAIVCSWRLRPDDVATPFETVFGDAPCIDEISSAQLEVLGGLALTIGDSALRARLCDVIWLRVRSHEHAREAARAYVASVETSLSNHVASDVQERLLRATSLCAYLGDTALQRLLADAIVVIAKRPGICDSFFFECFDSLRSSSGVDVVCAHQLIVDRAKITSNEIWVRKFWDLAATFAARAKQSSDQRDAIYEVARSYEREALAASKAFMATHHWENALKTYRRIPGTETDRERVHKKLLESQANLPAEMVSFESGAIEIGDLIQQAQNRIRGKDKPRALAELILASRWQEKSHIRAAAEGIVRDYPLQHMFSTVQLSSTGKAAAFAAGSGSQGMAEDQIRIEMARQYKFLIPTIVNGTIEPMRHELNLAHGVSLSDMVWIVNNSPIVPVGREPFFAIGLLAGLHGRFIEALHVLLPQVEHMFRALLVSHGMIASSVDSLGIQKEFDINQLLRSTDLENLLGEDLYFLLQVLLIDRFGWNLRNETAHGMLMPSAFFSEGAIYAWWLILRMVGHSTAISILDSQEVQDPAVDL